MSPAALTVVADNALPLDAAAAVAVQPPEPLADRVKRLQAEARMVARDHILALEEALASAARLASEIASGGDAYPVGAREVARQMILDCEGRAQTLDAILKRVR